MNTLISLGTITAFGYSLLATFAPRVLPEDVREVYYEVVTFIITIILLGRLIEAAPVPATPSDPWWNWLPSCVTAQQSVTRLADATAAAMVPPSLWAQSLLHLAGSLGPRRRGSSSRDSFYASS